MTREPPTYAITGGPPDDWNQLLVFWNEIEHQEFVEVNVTEGWGIRYKRDHLNRLVRDGDELATERVEGKFRLEYRT